MKYGVALQGGTPVPRIDGHEHSGWCYTTNVVDQPFCRDVGRHGIDFWSFRVSPNYNPKSRRT